MTIVIYKTSKVLGKYNRYVKYLNMTATLNMIISFPNLHTALPKIE